MWRRLTDGVTSLDMSEATQEVAVSEDALREMVGRYGVRGTARMLGMTETQANTFRQRVARGRWMDDPAIVALRSKAAPEPKPIVSTLSPVQAAAMELQGYSVASRLGHAKAASVAANHVSTLTGEELLADAGNVKALVQHASTTFAWQDQPPSSRMRIDVLLQRPEPLTIEAQIIDAEWHEEPQA